MSDNIIKFTGPKYCEEVREQACAWLSRLDKGASDEDMTQLVHWMQEDVFHTRMLINMAVMWDQSELLSELSEIFPLEEKQPSPKSRHPRLSFAFGVLAFIAVLMSTFFGLKKMDEWALTYAFNATYETAVGERNQINLRDGSVVTLNTNTRIRFSFDKNTRDVFLEHGEGFFTVAKDAGRPFRVHAGTRVVEAVGTAFTVQHTAAGKELEVLVTEGKVKFLELAAQDAVANLPGAERGETTIGQEGAVANVIPLAAGERLTIGEQVQKIERDQLAPDEVEVKMAWRVGMLVFQGEPLETVLQEVGRYTTTKLQADASVRDIRIDGLFRAGDIDGLLVAMEKNFNVSSQRMEGNQIFFTAGSQEE